MSKNKCVLGLLLGLVVAAGSSPSWAVNPRALDAALDAVLQREAQQYMDTSTGGEGTQPNYAYLAGMPPHTQIRALYQGRPYNFYFP